MTRRNKTSELNNGARPFEDSVFADPRDTLGKARRRALVLAEAKTARGISSDVDGAIFHAAQVKAIKARRASNRQFLVEHAGDPEFKASDLERWASLPAKFVKRKIVRSYISVLIGILLGAVTVLMFSRWAQEIQPSLQRSDALEIFGLDTVRYVDIEFEDFLEIPEQAEL